jgi:hypothetical protein
MSLFRPNKNWADAWSLIAVMLIFASCTAYVEGKRADAGSCLVAETGADDHRE